MRLDEFDLGAKRGEYLGKPTRGDHFRGRARRPLPLDPPHEAIDRVRGSKHYPRSNTLLCPPPDRPLRWDELGRGQFGGPPHERIGGRSNTWRNDPAKENPCGGGGNVGGFRARGDDKAV